MRFFKDCANHLSVLTFLGQSGTPVPTVLPQIRAINNNLSIAKIMHFKRDVEGAVPYDVDAERDYDGD